MLPEMEKGFVFPDLPTEIWALQADREKRGLSWLGGDISLPGMTESDVDDAVDIVKIF